MARRWLTATVAGVSGLLALAGMAVVPDALDAQAAPTLSASPLRVDPGDTYEVVVTGCSVEPELFVAHADVLVPLAVTAAADPDEWSASVSAGGVDGDEEVLGSCGSVELVAVGIDVELPYLGFRPQGSFGGPGGEVPTTIYGTDCPDGSTATVLVTSDSGEAPVRVEGIAIDGFGDWQLDLPDFVAGSAVVVEASCGDLVYDSLNYTVPRVVVELPPETRPEPAPTPATPPPAVPRAGSPTFTG